MSAITDRTGNPRRAAEAVARAICAYRPHAMSEAAGVFAREVVAAAFACDGLIIGGRDPARRNITDPLTAALSADPCLPRLQAGRLRSTWLHRCAQLIGLQAFMAAACSSASSSASQTIVPRTWQESTARCPACPRQGSCAWA